MTSRSTPTPVGPSATADPSSPPPGHARRWWVLAVVALAQLIVVLDATIVNIALPTAQQDIGFTDSSRQWVVTAYALAFGSLLLLGGRLGDLLGRKTTFMAGLVGFAAFSALGGAATDLGVLLVARGGQGVFGALLAPAALSLLSTTFTDAKERGRAFAIFGALAGAGGAIGLVLGGALTEYLSWRWCMYINVPLAAAALVGAALALPRAVRNPAARLDVPGVLLSITGLVSLVYGLADAETAGWTAASTLGLIALGVVLLAVFCVVETRVADPLLPMRVLLDRNRGGSYLAIGVVGAGMFGIFLFVTYYLTAVLGMAPLPTGLAFLPMVAGIAVAAQIVPAVVTRIGVKVPVAAGLAIAAVGMATLTRLGADSAYVTGVLPGLVIAGIGLGLVLPSAMSAAVDRVDVAHAGVASAAVNTFQQIGGSIGTAVLSAVAAAATTSRLTAGDPQNPTVRLAAAVDGYTTAFAWSAAIFAVGAVVSAVLLRHGRLAVDPDAEPVLAH